MLWNPMNNLYWHWDHVSGIAGYFTVRELSIRVQGENENSGLFFPSSSDSAGFTCDRRGGCTIW